MAEDRYTSVSLKKKVARALDLVRREMGEKSLPATIERLVEEKLKR